MSWGRIDDKAWLDPKFTRLTFEARGVWFTIFSWCCHQSNGGLFTTLAIEDLIDCRYVELHELHDAGLLDYVGPVAVAGGGCWVQLHNFLKWNPGCNKERKVEQATQAAIARVAVRTDLTRDPECLHCRQQKRACRLHRKRKKPAAAGPSTSAPDEHRTSTGRAQDEDRTLPDAILQVPGMIEARPIPSHPIPSQPSPVDRERTGKEGSKEQHSQSNPKPQTSLDQQISNALQTIWPEWPKNPASFENKPKALAAMTSALSTESDIISFTSAALNYSNKKLLMTGSEHGHKTMTLTNFCVVWRDYLPDPDDVTTPASAVTTTDDIRKLLAGT